MPMHRHRSSVRPFFHLFPALPPPLLYFATAPFLPALSPFSCPHCDVNNSCFCRTRPASARKISLYGDRQPRCRQPSHPAYGDRHPCCRRPPHTQRYMHNRRQRAHKRRNNTPQTAGPYALHHQQYFLQLSTTTRYGKQYKRTFLHIFA